MQLHVQSAVPNLSGAPFSPQGPTNQTHQPRHSPPLHTTPVPPPPSRRSCWSLAAARRNECRYDSTPGALLSPHIVPQDNVHSHTHAHARSLLSKQPSTLCLIQPSRSDCTSLPLSLFPLPPSSSLHATSTRLHLHTPPPPPPLPPRASPPRRNRARLGAAAGLRQQCVHHAQVRPHRRQAVGGDHARGGGGGHANAGHARVAAHRQAGHRRLGAGPALRAGGDGERRGRVLVGLGWGYLPDTPPYSS